VAEKAYERTRNFAPNVAVTDAEFGIIYSIARALIRYVELVAAGRPSWAWSPVWVGNSAAKSQGPTFLCW
jgi:hypothetical protein